MYLRISNIGSLRLQNYVRQSIRNVTPEEWEKVETIVQQIPPMKNTDTLKPEYKQLEEILNKDGYHSGGSLISTINAIKENLPKNI